MNLGTLFLLFLVLKLTGVIAWSWLAVTSPLWVVPAIFTVLFATVFIVGGLIALVALLIGAIARK